MRTSLLAALALALTACGSGGSSDHPDAGKPDAGDPLVVFGLATGSCYELSSGDAAVQPPALGMAIEDLSAEGTNNNAIWYLPDGGSPSVSAISLVYRQTGALKMIDHLVIDGQNVLLLRRDVQGAEQIEYHPAIVVARVPIKDPDHLDELDGGVRVFGGDGGSALQPYAFTLDGSKETLATPANATTAAFTYHYADTPSLARLSSWSFELGTGTTEVALQLPGDTGVPIYKLQGARQLASGGDQTCGTATTP